MELGYHLLHRYQKMGFFSNGHVVAIVNPAILSVQITGRTNESGINLAVFASRISPALMFFYFCIAGMVACRSHSFRSTL